MKTKNIENLIVVLKRTIDYIMKALSPVLFGLLSLAFSPKRSLLSLLFELIAVDCL